MGFIRLKQLKTLSWILALPVLFFLRGSSATGDDLIITEDTVLDPNLEYGRIIIRGSNITVDGRGAWLVGPKFAQAKEFQQTAVFSEGTSGVTLRNVNAKGWETGLHVKDSNGWKIEGCNFSDNFHDPEFGWGENGRRGGILLENVSGSALRNNRANHVWDACTMVRCSDNLIEDNDFSHTSNTCLKLWESCRNRINKNNLSYGLRIKAEEVHARDSTCVLIESGSNDNHFTKNDCTHGGDGIFIRVLNQWISTGNIFVDNDCSYANNNCVEAWSPRNTWIRNKANHGSYGFWLGASDQNVLIANEASFNGLADGFHNSPHLPDGHHAGIVFMFGPSSHTLLRDNICIGNHGAGIAAIGDLDSKGQKWKAFHWVIERNVIRDNRWGIYLQHAEMLDVAANQFSGNAVADVSSAENVGGLVRHKMQNGIEKPPVAELAGPEVVTVGEDVIFDATGSSDPEGRPIAFRWQIPPEVSSKSSRLTHTFSTPGFYRVALTVNNGLLSDLAWRDLYVVENVSEIGTESDSDGGNWVDDQSEVLFRKDPDVRICGQSSIRADIAPYSGTRVTLRYLTGEEPIEVREANRLVFWLKTRNENVPAWQDVNPVIAINGINQQSLHLTPIRDFLSQPPYVEAREGWTYFEVPLAGNQQWKRDGEIPSSVESFDFGFDSWGAPPLSIWIDGVGLK